MSSNLYRGQDLKLVLWGDRAVEFEEEAARARNEETAVIGIFVGTLPKNSQGFSFLPFIHDVYGVIFEAVLFNVMSHSCTGTKSLSGSSACCWYIDEDLPAINSFRARFFFAMLSLFGCYIMLSLSALYADLRFFLITPSLEAISHPPLYMLPQSRAPFQLAFMKSRLKRPS